MTKILAIDTSSEACSVALSIGDEILETFEVLPKLHARKLLPMVQSLLDESGVKLAAVDAIAFGRGPGSFTGLRICAGVVQGLAFGADLPVIPVSTLGAIAQGVYRTTQCTEIVTVLDARMAEIYWACFRVAGGRVKVIGEEHLSAPRELDIATTLLSQSSSWLGVGDGWHFAGEFPAHVAEHVKKIDLQVYPHARDIVTLAIDEYNQGHTLAAEQALPVYMRGKSAWRKAT